MAGAPIGNQNAAKGRRMARIFEGICAEEEYKRIKAGINAALDKFAEGDLKAGEFVRDSTEGKPAQSLTVAGDPENPMQHRVEVVIVDKG